MDRLGIKRPLLFDDSGDARRWRMAEDLGGIRSKPAAAGSAVICVDGSQRRAPSIIAVWLRLMRTERDRPAGAGRSRCWPTLRYKAGAVLRRGSGGFSLSGRSAAGVLLFHFEGANTDGTLLLRRMRRTRITSTHAYGTHRLPVVFFLGGHSSANLEQASSCAVMQPDTV